MKSLFIILVALCPFTAIAHEGPYGGSTNRIESTRLRGELYRLVMST